jgi:20S proteasome alpha/beta subunit
MTFQVGIFGKDGLVLAGDTRAVHEDNVRWTTTQSKFIHDPDMQIVVAQSGHSVSLKVAQDLVRENWDGDVVKGREIAESVYAQEFEGIHSALRDQYPTQLIVVRPKERRMFHLCVRERTEVRECCAGKLVSGDSATVALFFLERYSNPSMCLKELTRVAALTVWLTGEINPLYVNGLEIMEFPDGGNPRRLDGAELDQLTEWARNADSRIRRLLAMATP